VRIRLILAGSICLAAPGAQGATGCPTSHRKVEWTSEVAVGGAGDLQAAIHDLVAPEGSKPAGSSGPPTTCETYLAARDQTTRMS
jgi:hypothetical protein